MIAIIVYLSLIIRQLNIVGVYLNGLLLGKETIYMVMPKRLHIRGKLMKFCELLQTIYMLKQLGKVWNKRFVRYLKKRGFVLMTADASILVNDEKKIIIDIYVNDVIFAAKDLQLIDRFET